MTIDKSTLTEKSNIAVYNATTRPKKPKRRDKSDLGTDFEAPDGGWGWVVCLAAGFSNFSIFPPFQQFGLIYRQRMFDLGFDAKQTTTIANIIMAISSMVGIVNGAMFRRFTFRQVAITGAVLVFIGTFLSAFSTTFAEYVICYSCIYGIGIGLNMAATSLAVNTYFKNNRRRATGFSWTITGLGPILFPYISTALLVYYGVQGTILVFSAISLNAILCGITLQPVLWHAKKPHSAKEAEAKEAEAKAAAAAAAVKPKVGEVMVTSVTFEEPEYECRYCQLERRRAKRSIFSSQYLFNDDDPEKPGYEITEPGTPMLARANDGWFGSKISLASDKGMRLRQKVLRQASTTKGRDCGLEANGVGGEPLHGENSALYKPNYFNREREDVDHYVSRTSVYSKPGEDEYRCTCAEEKALLQQITDEERRLEQEQLKAALEAEEKAKAKMSFGQKVVKFFDLDLLKDLTFVNLVMGMTIMLFAEMNFSVLTPFILNSFGYENTQISLAMSLLGGVDISVRFLAPFALEKVKLDNRVLFAFGIMAITVGRFIITLTDSFNVILAVFILIGFGKGFRTIFLPLILPSYVPLKRLPAASGLQLIFNAVFSIACGPILGMITDATSYRVSIHVLNSLTCFALLMWLAESVGRRLLAKKAKPVEGH